MIDNKSKLFKYKQVRAIQNKLVFTRYYAFLVFVSVFLTASMSPLSAVAGRLYALAGLGYDFASPAVHAGDDVVGNGIGTLQYGPIKATTSTGTLDTYNTTVGIGYQFSPYFKSDLSWSHFFKGSHDQHFDVAGTPTLSLTSLTSDALLWQSYLTPFHFQVGHIAVAPFLGAGFGVAYNRVGIKSKGIFKIKSGVTPNLAWDINTGLESRLNDHWAIAVGYRYIDLGPTSAEKATLSVNDNGTLKPLTVKTHKSLSDVSNSEIYANAIYYLPKNNEADPYTKMDSVALGNTYFKLDGDVAVNSFLFNKIGEEFPYAHIPGSSVEKKEVARVQFSAGGDVAIGNNILPWLGTELMLSYRRFFYIGMPKVNDFSLGNVDGTKGYHRSLAGFMNMNIHPWRAREKNFDIEPYFNFGLGLSDNRMPRMSGDLKVNEGGTQSTYHFVEPGTNNMSLAWMAGTGLEIRFHNHWGFVTGVRFTNLGHYSAHKAYITKGGTPGTTLTNLGNHSSPLYTIEALAGFTYHL